VTIIHKTIEPNLAIDSVPKVQTLKHPSHFWLQKSENPMEKSVYFPRLLENLGNQKAKKPHISRHLEQKNQLAKYRPKSPISHVFGIVGFLFSSFSWGWVKPIASSCFRFLPNSSSRGNIPNRVNQQLLQ